MTQRAIGAFPIPESTTSGTQLARILENTEAARNSNDAGATRPGYLAAGGLWSKDLSGGKYDVMLYDGSADIPLIEDTGNAGGLPVFSTTDTYAVGDMLAYQSGIYVCNTPHTGAWNAARFNMISAPVGTITGQVPSWNNATKEWESTVMPLTFKTGGNVGVGNTNPDAQLEVGASTDTGIRAVRVSGQYAEFQCRASDSGGFMISQSTALASQRWGWQWSNATDRWTLSTKGTAKEMMVGGGKVSINYTGLVYALTVNGQIAATSASIINISDKRMKKHIGKLPSTVDIVKNLNPVRFQYKAHDELDFGEGWDLGFIAQEVEETIEGQPWAHRVVHTVETPDGPGRYMIDNVKLLPVTIKALQEALEKIDELEARILQLES